MPWFRKRSENSPRVASDTGPNGVYSEMRHLALTRKSTDIGITPSPQAPAWGVLMESRFGTVTMTLMALADGSTSMYLSNGGGVIGGHGHEIVRRANAAFLTQINNHLTQFKPCETFPVPEPAHTLFYALTDSGILTASALDDDLGHGRAPLSPVFLAGHGVITQLRMVSGIGDE